MNAGDWIKVIVSSGDKQTTVTYSNGNDKLTKCGLYVGGKRVKTLTFEPTFSLYKYRDVGVGDLAVDGELKFQSDLEDAGQEWSDLLREHR